MNLKYLRHGYTSPTMIISLFCVILGCTKNIALYPKFPSLPGVDKFVNFPQQEQFTCVRSSLVVHLSIHVYHLTNCSRNISQHLLVHAELRDVSECLSYRSVVLEERLIELLLEETVLDVCCRYLHSLGFREQPRVHLRALLK